MRPVFRRDRVDPAGARARYEAAGVLPWRLALANGITRIRTGEAPAEIAATVRPAGSTRRVRWTTASPHVTLSAAEGERITVTGANGTETPQVAEIRALADNGFYSTAWVTVDPAYRPAPALVAEEELAERQRVLRDRTARRCRTLTGI